MYVVVSQFVIANDKVEEVREAFRNRPHQVENAPGFIRMEVISPIDEPAAVWLMTFWENKNNFETWHRSHRYKESHVGIPARLKLVPGKNRITCFDHICS